MTVTTFVTVDLIGVRNYCVAQRNGAYVVGGVIVRVEVIVTTTCDDWEHSEQVLFPSEVSHIPRSLRMLGEPRE